MQRMWWSLTALGMVGSPAMTLPFIGPAWLAGCDPQASCQEASFSNGWFVSGLKASPSHCPSSAALSFATWALGGLCDFQHSQQVHQPLHKSSLAGSQWGSERANLIGPAPSVITVIYDNNYSPFYFSATYLNVDVHY